MASIERITRIGFVNAYLVEEQEGYTLLDTAISGSAKKLLARASQGGRPITRIVLTHAHDDHVGSLDALVAALPGVEVIISTRDARLLAGDRKLDAEEPHVKLKGGLKGARSQPTTTVSGGERIGSLEVLPAPGHTPGHIALLDTRDRTLLCGDAFTTLGGVETTARIPWRFPLAGAATWHRPTALASARELQALRPARLAPGHGRIVQDPGAAIAAAIARAS